MAIISYGAVDKKLLILVIMTLVRIIDTIFESEFGEEYLEDVVSGLLREVGPIITAIILIFTLKQKPNKIKKSKKHFKYVFILLLLRIVKTCYERVFPFVVKDSTYRFGRLLNTTNGLEINLITLGTFLLMKYKYYIHHMLSMFLFLALSITNDFIIKSYFSIKYNYFYIYILYLIEEVSVYCFIKYMMDKLYYQYMEVLLYWGITGLLSKIIVISSLIIYEYKSNTNEIVKSMHDFFIEKSVYGIIFIEFVYWLIYTGLYYPLLMLVLYYLKPNHMVASDEINIFFNLIFYQEKPNKYYTLIPFVFQIFSLLVYFEIIELNFCKLNFNTAKNIEQRERKDGEQRNLSMIELGDNYYLSDSDRKTTGDEIKDVSGRNDSNIEAGSLPDKSL